MKKIFTLCLLFCGLTAMAQTVAFVDKDGNQIADGSTIVRNETEVDPFDPETAIIHSGLFVKNIGSVGYDVVVEANITQLDNGSVQLCFPLVCKTSEEVGTILSDRATVSTTDAPKDIQSEWIATGYGACTIIYTAKAYAVLTNNVVDSYTVTVNYVYADPAGIGKVTVDAIPQTYYNLSGQSIAASQHGLNIVRLADGRTIKIIKK